MTLQIILSALLALVAAAFLVVPLLRRPERSARRADYDIQVYRDQLREIDRDVERGLLTDAQASAARLEIQRRMLATDAEAPNAGGGESGGDRFRPVRVGLAVAMAVAVPVAGLALYAGIGAPGLPDRPHAERLTERLGLAAADIEGLRTAAASLEERLAAEPENQAGWLLLAETRAQLQDWPRVLDAYNRAVRLGGVGGDVWASLGEAHVFAGGGQLGDPARAAFRNALRADRGDPRARYYLGLGYLQDDEPRKALAVWRDLSASSPSDAPWMPMLRQRMNAAGQQAGIMPVTVAAIHPLDLHDAEERGEELSLEATGSEDQSAPAQSDGSAAPGLTAEEQEMVDGMVASLAQRLEESPDDVDGWVRLGRSYGVLGRFADAVDAYDRAVALRPDDVDLRFAQASALMAQASALMAQARQADQDPPPAFFAAMDAVLERQPENPDALYYAGLGAATKGDSGEARRLWSLLLDVLPADSPERAEIEARLRDLPPAG